MVVGFLCGILGATRTVFAFILLMYAFILFQRSRAHGLIIGMIGMFVTVCLHGFFLPWEQEHYSALHLFWKGRNSSRWSLEAPSSHSRYPGRGLSNCFALTQGKLCLSRDITHPWNLIRYSSNRIPLHIPPRKLRPLGGRELFNAPHPNVYSLLRESKRKRTGSLIPKGSEVNTTNKQGHFGLAHGVILEF